VLDVRFVIELGLVLSILISCSLGTLLGFSAGLVPGLHMNNIAAGLTTNAGATLAVFALVDWSSESNQSDLLAACFISSALVAHLFGEAITCTYVGIPAEDVVSVLPAHRLAKAGLGTIAVRSSANGALFGLVVSSILLFPMCCVMGWPIGLYSVLRKVMGFFMIFLSVFLVLSEGSPRQRVNGKLKRRLSKVMKATALFAAAGLLGQTVLSSSYSSSHLPDVPWLQDGLLSPSSLLLPLFAGLFGVPSLLLSLGSRRAFDIKGELVPLLIPKTRARDVVLTLLGGIMVGWMPGMTSGSSVSVCSPNVRESSSDEGIANPVRFIWLYSSISASGAVFALGALFVIMRARSGSMDAVTAFLGSADIGSQWLSNVGMIASLLLSMLIAGVLSRIAVDGLMPHLSRLGGVLCSKQLALISLAFVCCLSVAITGTRGALVMFAASMLGMLPPMVGIRRIQLMGCLLVPISMMFVENMSGRGY